MKSCGMLQIARALNCNGKQCIDAKRGHIPVKVNV